MSLKAKYAALTFGVLLVFATFTSAQTTVRARIAGETRSPTRVLSRTVSTRTTRRSRHQVEGLTQKTKPDTSMPMEGR